MRRLTFSALVAVAVAVGVALFAGLGSAKNSVTFTDRTGDSGSGADISTVVVSNDDAGVVNFDVTTSNRAQGLAAGEAVSIAIDADGSSITGNRNRGGADFVLERPAGQAAPRLLRWDSSRREFVADAALASSVGRDWGTRAGSAGVVRLFIRQSLLKFKRVFGFSVLSAAGATAADYAPDAATDTFLYEIKLRDAAPPTVRVLASTGRRGAAVRLRFRMTEDSGKATPQATVYRGKTPLATVRGRAVVVQQSRIYTLTWKAPPRTKRGALAFCVRAADAAGNRSAPACGPLTLR